MLLFTKLRRFGLTDNQGRHARLVDFVVDLYAEGYPPITHILFRHSGLSLKILPWDAVVSLDHSTGQIKVKDIEAGERVNRNSLRTSVLINDIDDALVLDLAHNRATRVNGLLLKEEDGRLFLSGIDTSMSAILRRLTGGRFSYVPETKVRDWNVIVFLLGDPLAVKNKVLPEHHGITQLPAGEIALLTSQLPYMHAAELITLLPDALAINTLEAMNTRRLLQVFEELDEERASCLLELMAPDVAADLLGALQTATMQRFLDRLSRIKCERIVELLCYPDHTVGGIMTNDIVFAPMRLTVAQAREDLRIRLKEPDFVYLIFIVDNEVSKKQVGIVPLRDLLTCEDDQTLEEIMDTRVPTLGSLQSAERAAFKVIESQLAALPVVGSEGELLGAVTIDAAVQQAAPPSWGSQAPRIFS